MHLETERMMLRDFTIEDLDDLHEIFGDDEAMLNAEPAYSKEKTEEFLKFFCILKKGAFAAVLKETKKVIGYILFKPTGEKKVYEIGWIFNKRYWRKRVFRKSIQKRMTEAGGICTFTP